MTFFAWEGERLELWKELQLCAEAQGYNRWENYMELYEIWNDEIERGAK